MTLKMRVDVKFPAEVTVQSPLVLTKTGRNYDFSIDALALFGGAVGVWQLRVALKNAGLFDDVDNHASFAVDPGGKIYEVWTSGGVRTSFGDDLSDQIAVAIGAAATEAAYAAATAIIL